MAEHPNEHVRTVDDQYVEWSIPSASTPIKGPPCRVILTADFSSGCIEVEDVEVTSSNDTARTLADGRRNSVMLTREEALWLLARIHDALAAIAADDALTRRRMADEAAQSHADAEIARERGAR